MAYANCKLVSGFGTNYHAASKPDKRPYNPKAFKYIGDGYIRIVGGVDQYGTELLSFYILIPSRARYLK